MAEWEDMSWVASHPRPPLCALCTGWERSGRGWAAGGFQGRVWLKQPKHLPVYSKLLLFLFPEARLCQQWGSCSNWRLEGAVGIRGLSAQNQES